MTPGRELDARVAERVMGCPVKIGPFGAAYCPCEYTDIHAGPPHGGKGAGLARYSEDIAAAWAVVERMREQHDYWGRLEVDASDSASAEFIMVNGPIHRAWAKTLPHAICLAALQAVDGKEGA